MKADQISVLVVRRKSGFSLPTVVALGVVAGLWVVGTAALVIPSTGRVAKERAADVTRSSAEAALDWACRQINDPATKAAVDGQTVSVPSSVLGGSNLSGTINVTRPVNGAPTTSYLYDRQCDPAVTASLNGAQSEWRVLTATVGPTGNATAQRTVRVILKPMYVSTQTSTSGPPQAMFVASALALEDIGGNGNIQTDSYDSDTKVNPTGGDFSKTDADVLTNTFAKFVGNADIGGELKVLNEVDPNDLNKVVAQLSNGVQVREGASANGQIDAPNSVTQTEGLNNDQMQVPQTPTAPSNVVDLPPITNSKTLTAGNYRVPYISLAGNKQLTIDSSGGPVNIYVDGAGNNGISLLGNGLVHTGGKPANLRIWYNGEAPTKIAGNGAFRGVVFAPNSGITVTGNGAMYGALIGNSIDFKGNGTLHYDRALAKANDLWFSPTITTSVPEIKKYQAVSWDEL